MDDLEHDFIPVLLADHEPPCLSLYQATHRHQPSRQQDLIRFRNLVDQLEAALLRNRRARDVSSLLAPFRTLADDKAFWSNTLDGLAVLATSNLFRVYRLQRPVPELAVVADTFHTKPLLRILQSADRYQVLGLSRGDARIFEGNRDEVDEISLAPEATTILAPPGSGEDRSERSTRVYGGGDSGKTTRHGTDVRSEARANQTERFFRDVDELVLEHHSRPTRLPLLLAALPENQRLFRDVSANPFLESEGIETNPDALTLEQIRERAWEIVRPRYTERLNEIIERFEDSMRTGLATDNMAEAAKSVAAARVGVLLIEAERHIPGVFDPSTGSVQCGSLDADDLLDDLGERVLKTGGEVVVVPGERMPTASGIAAIYRF